MGIVDRTEIEHRHPSFGTLQISRVSGSGPLFGSVLDQHYHTIRIAVNHGYAIEGEMGEQRYRASEQIVELELSAAQFVEVIGTMNVAEGIPCTIRRLHRKSVDAPPVVDNATARAHTAFEQKMRDFGRALDGLVREVNDATEAKGLTKDARQRIRTAVGAVAMEVKSNIPFYAKLFNEAADKIVVAAKAEADAWLTHTINRAGLNALRSLPVGTTITSTLPILPETTEDP